MNSNEMSRNKWNRKKINNMESTNARESLVYWFTKEKNIQINKIKTAQVFMNDTII